MQSKYKQNKAGSYNTRAYNSGQGNRNCQSKAIGKFKPADVKL